MTEKIKVWVTKYALSDGIVETEGMIRNVQWGKDEVRQICDVDGYISSFQVRDYHLSRAAAVERAIEMRDRKIKSLEKQINRLKKMEF